MLVCYLSIYIEVRCIEFWISAPIGNVKVPRVHVVVERSGTFSSLHFHSMGNAVCRKRNRAGVPRAEKAGHLASLPKSERRCNVCCRKGSWQYNNYKTIVTFFVFFPNGENAGWLSWEGDFLLSRSLPVIWKGLKNRDTFTSRITPLSFFFFLLLVWIYQKERRKKKKEFLFPPLISGVADVGSRNPLGPMWSSPELLLIVLQQPVFFSNGLFCLLTPGCVSVGGW